MFTKLMIKMRTYYMTLNITDLIEKIFDKNILISSIAKEEFLKRDFDDLDVSDDILKKVINKLSIEEIWEIVKNNEDNHFTDLVIQKLNTIFDYYEKKEAKSFLLKINENGKIFKLLK